MNRTHLDQIIKNYMDNFEATHSSRASEDRNELLKWDAVSCFKSYWDKDDPHFSEMFERAMNDTKQLLENQAAQPITGILRLLEYPGETEYVRGCFDLLFSDSTDLEQKSHRVEMFLDMMNVKLKKYFSGSFKYVQTMEHVVFYMNLYQPEDNFIYQGTEAKCWALCMDVPAKFGTKNFSLQEYYDMCQDTLDALEDYPELIEKVQDTTSELMLNFDDQLHLLVYDIISCATTYKYHEQFGIKSTGNRTTAQSAAKKAEELQKKKKIEACDLSLQDIVIPELPNITGMAVSHKKFGEGTVTSIADGKMTIQFAIGEKKLKYPDPFATGFMSLDNEEYMQIFANYHRAVAQKETITFKKNLVAKNLY